MQDPIVITAAARTAIGGFQGQFRDLPAPALGAAVIAAVLERSGLAADSVSQVYLGNVLSAGLGQAPARQAALLAGMPASVPCTGISKVCGSGMQAVMIAHDLLRTGTLASAIAGGMENMSRAPLLLGRERGAHQAGLRDHLLVDGMLDACAGPGSTALGLFAEAMASARGLSRAAQDAQVILSVSRAAAARAAGAFDREIVPVLLPDGQSATDDEPLLKALPEKIAALKPLFGTRGTVTAASASPFADGAAALLLMRRSEAAARNLPARAILRGHASHAQAPDQFSTAPVGAVRKLLAALGWSAESVQLYEISEGFAVGVLAVMQELGAPAERVNVHGGACALGHPIGASGARIVVTLLHALERHGLQRGIATICMGGGEATALALELPD